MSFLARIRPCSREKELAELLRRGGWPGLAAPEMRAHVAQCGRCRDLVAVTEVFQQARAASSAQTRLESPGVLWWRAQLRRRNAALKQVSRPLVAAQLFAMALGLVAAAVCLAFAARSGSGSGSGWLRLVLELPAAFHIPGLLPQAWQNTPAPWVVLLTLAALALMGGVFVYRASEER